MRAPAKFAMTMAIQIIVVACLMFAVTISKADAHSWYSGTTDPVSKYACCGGNDCAPVPLDMNWVQPVQNGFRVLLSLNEARIVNKNSEVGVDEFVPWSRVQSPPADAGAPGHSPALYHICIVAGHVYCLFVVPST